MRPSTTVEKLAALETLVALGMCDEVAGAPGGRVTAGNASQVSDGAAALLVANEAGLKKLGAGATPLAEVVGLQVRSRALSQSARGRQSRLTD